MSGRISVRKLCEGGIIAALYTVLTCLLAPLSFGEVQFRVSEALTLLPVAFSSAVPGLAIGCFAANLLCGAPVQDIIFGSLATLLAAYLTRFTRKNIAIAALMPVLCNGVIVGLTLAYVYALPPFLTMGSVALGEAGACYLLGVPLIRALRLRGLEREAGKEAKP